MIADMMNALGDVLFEHETAHPHSIFKCLNHIGYVA